MVIKVIDYSERAFLVTGEETREIKEEIRTECNGKWNPPLRGWVVSKKYQKVLSKLVGTKKIHARGEEEEGLTLKRYILITGSTRPIKEELSGLGAVWIPSLTGWVLPKRKKSLVPEVDGGEVKIKRWWLLVGDTRKFKDELKELGAVWLMKNDVKGWLLPYKMGEEIKELFSREE